VPAIHTFDYAIIRVVPRVEREEFLNVGVLFSCPLQSFLEARIELDIARLQAFAPALDVGDVQKYLEVIPRVCAGGKEAGPIGQMPQRARFHWLVAPRSTIIQVSPVHAGLCESLEGALEHLMNTMVRRVRSEEPKTKPPSKYLEGGFTAGVTD
jgi:hypothetical protein